MPPITKALAEIISSAKNPLLREVRRATARGELTTDGWAVAESFHLLEEAIRSERRVAAVLAAESVWPAVERHVRGLRDARVLRIADSAFRQIASTETTQGVIALVEMPRWTVEDVVRRQAMVVVLDGVQDPGNAGAIVRSAEAFGATGALFLKGAVSPFNPKTLRAAAGSLFRLPFLAGIDGGLARATLDQRRIAIYAADPRGKILLGESDLRRPFALIVGSEGHGISERLSNGAIDLRIPTLNVESLNAAMAATIICYEAARQRMQR